MEHDEHYVHRASFTSQASSEHIENPLGLFIKTQLAAYFKNPNHRFQLPLRPQGSVYQQRIWQALLVIPAGRTLRYGELALSLQTGARAVGQACRKNPLPLFLPCHRVVGKHNHGGYMGAPEALGYKIALLEHEATNYINLL